MTSAEIWMEQAILARSQMQMERVIGQWRIGNLLQVDKEVG